MGNIPILDLQRQYTQIGSELERRALEVLRSGNYILGRNVEELEKSVAQLCGCSHGVGVANGTDALILALWSCDIGPGDEVITTPFTFAATAEAIAIRGARAVFVDIDPNTFNINPDLIEQAVTPATKAIIPVHLYGQPADMDKITAIARRHGLKVIEDNAQAIGALYKGRPTGSLGDVACVSFYPTKNLGACGDAGMLVTGSQQVAERLQVLRAHGMRVRYYHDEVGVNSRLDEIQAVALLTKFPHLPAWNERRRQIAALYTRALSQCPGIKLPAVSADCLPVWHQYTIRVTGGAYREQLQRKLSAAGVGSTCYYPVPLHRQKAFAALGYKEGDFPVTELVSGEVLSLPMYPELTDSEVQYVCEAIKTAMEASQAFVPAYSIQPAAIIP